MSDLDQPHPVFNHILSRSIIAIAVAAFLVFMPADFVAQRSEDPKLDRAIAKANSEFVEAMKTGNTAIIAAPYTDDAVFVMIDGTCVRGARKSKTCIGPDLSVRVSRAQRK